MGNRPIKLERMDYMEKGAGIGGPKTYHKKSDAEIVGRGHINPGSTSYLPADEWELIRDAMNSGLDSRIFELELEIMKKEQELSLLKYVKESPEKYFNKEEING